MADCSSDAHVQPDDATEHAVNANTSTQSRLPFTYAAALAVPQRERVGKRAASEEKKEVALEAEREAKMRAVSKQLLTEYHRVREPDEAAAMTQEETPEPTFDVGLQWMQKLKDSRAAAVVQDSCAAADVPKEGRAIVISDAARALASQGYIPHLPAASCPATSSWLVPDLVPPPPQQKMVQLDYMRGEYPAAGHPIPKIAAPKSECDVGVFVDPRRRAAVGEEVSANELPPTLAKKKKKKARAKSQPLPGPCQPRALLLKPHVLDRPP